MRCFLFSTELLSHILWDFLEHNFHLLRQSLFSLHLGNPLPCSRQRLSSPVDTWACPRVGPSARGCSWPHPSVCWCPFVASPGSPSPSLSHPAKVKVILIGQDHIWIFSNKSTFTSCSFWTKNYNIICKIWQNEDLGANDCTAVTMS